MGRELRRVPLDFNWPLNKVWQGFINPHGQPCPEIEKDLCHAGTSNAGKWLDAIVRLLALIGEQATANTPEYEAYRKHTGAIYPHPWLQEWRLAPRTDMMRTVPDEINQIEDRIERWNKLNSYLSRNPSQLLGMDAELVELIGGLAQGRQLSGFGGGPTYEIWKTLLKAAGIERKDWGVCKVCNGHGLHPDSLEAYESWEREPPPTGEGWQLWETVSEGSPISIVYRSEAEFVAYLIAEGYSYQAAKSFAQTGWAPSGVIQGGTMYNDIESMGIDRD